MGRSSRRKKELLLARDAAAIVAAGLAGIKLFNITTPCATCPFRTDIVPFLTAGSVQKIRDDLTRTSFWCHKTCYTGKLGHRPREERQHCAGALILLRKMDCDGPIQQIASRLGIYDPSKLDMNAPVYDTFEAMIGAQRG